jgi:hypothetical protein
VVHLVSFEPTNAWDPPSITLMSHVVVGERQDLRWAWAECHPALKYKGGTYDLLLLESRDRNQSVWSADDGPIHVYVCTTSKENEALDELPRNAVRVIAWGILG